MVKSGKRRIYILIGPKGSGKTYIGNLLEQELGIKFLRVEQLLLKHIEKNGLSNKKLTRDGFDIEEKALADALIIEDTVIFEATGSSIYMPSVLENLAKNYELKLIKISCPLNICFERVKNRSQQHQFKVEDEIVRQINKKAAKVVLDWDLVIDNSEPATKQNIITKFTTII